MKNENKKINTLEKLTSLIMGHKKLKVIKQWDDCSLGDEVYTSFRGLIFSEKEVKDKTILKDFKDIADEAVNDGEYDEDERDDAIDALNGLTDLSICFDLEKDKDNNVTLAIDIIADYPLDLDGSDMDEVPYYNIETTIINNTDDLDKFLDKTIIEFNKGKKCLWG